MDKMTLTDIDVNNKKVLMRVDFNVPIEDGKITDDNRIVQALPSIKHVVDNNGLLILMSHLGRPGGSPDPELSLKPVADYLRTLVDTQVYFAEDCVGEKAESVIAQAKPGEIVVLENVRFHAGEKANDEEFCKQLAAHGDLFVNDAFGSSHRAHSSVAGVTRFLQPAVSGFLLEKEIKYLSDAINNPIHPFIAILGGAKVSDKIGVIENLLDKVDTILIGGGMTYTFYKAKGLPIGDSLVEEEKVELAGELLKKAEEAGVDLALPIDHIVAKEFKNDAEHKVVGEDEIEDGWMGLDIGPQTTIAFGNKIKNANTIVWNGPMGVFEMDSYADGTFSIAEELAQTTENGATTIIGGGDSAAAIKKTGLEDKVSHVSTGGGASLMFLEGKDLPGVLALTNK
ncbi:phosphoglycerate kinase [Aliifodinibius sp. S!AR15-10]|uniref:phosphoglycerate kinase n=1 Tax=Aliifodinibius sp. S!AR15-10 TaxID=2950437 RepID=UPI00285B685B|nr:phosphoglycerate kinase [Aliifodinibius sp. S!AR15-10]MDR8390333.1 phosphoglycerate kinase [Aliifodinibius sp. S!AR15-10]